MKEEGEARSSIYRLIKHAEQGKNVTRKKGSGRKPKFNTSSKRARLKRIFDHRKGVSLRKASKKFKCSKSTISNMLKKMKKPIICYKRSKRPNRTPVQRLVARPKCRKLYYKYRNYNFIIDDESYFTFSNANLSGNDTFYSSDRNMTNESVKYNDKA